MEYNPFRTDISFVFDDAYLPVPGFRRIYLLGPNPAWEAALRKRAVFTWACVIPAEGENSDAFRRSLVALGQPFFTGHLAQEGAKRQGYLVTGLRRKQTAALAASLPLRTVVWAHVGELPDVVYGLRIPPVAIEVGVIVSRVSDIPIHISSYVSHMAYQQLATPARRVQEREANASLIASVPGALELVAKSGDLGQAIALLAAHEHVASPLEALRVDMVITDWHADISVRAPSGRMATRNYRIKALAQAAEGSSQLLAREAARLILATWLDATVDGRMALAPGLRLCGKCRQYRGTTTVKFLSAGILESQPQAHRTIHCDCERDVVCRTCRSARVPRPGLIFQYDATTNKSILYSYASTRECGPCGKPVAPRPRPWWRRLFSWAPGVTGQADGNRTRTSK